MNKLSASIEHFYTPRYATGFIFHYLISPVTWRPLFWRVTGLIDQSQTDQSQITARAPQHYFYSIKKQHWPFWKPAGTRCHEIPQGPCWPPNGPDAAISNNLFSFLCWSWHLFWACCNLDIDQWQRCLWIVSFDDNAAGDKMLHCQTAGEIPISDFEFRFLNKARNISNCKIQFKNQVLVSPVNNNKFNLN